MRIINVRVTLRRPAGKVIRLDQWSPWDSSRAVRGAEEYCSRLSTLRVHVNDKEMCEKGEWNEAVGSAGGGKCQKLVRA